MTQVQGRIKVLAHSCSGHGAQRGLSMQQLQGQGQYFQ
jgi:hypothetical protein